MENESSFESESLTNSSIDSDETCMQHAEEVFDKHIDESTAEDIR